MMITALAPIDDALTDDVSDGDRPAILPPPPRPVASEDSAALSEFMNPNTAESGVTSPCGSTAGGER